MDVRVHLTNNGEIDIELVIQRLRGYICAQASIFELMSIVVWHQV